MAGSSEKANRLAIIMLIQSYVTLFTLQYENQSVQVYVHTTAQTSHGLCSRKILLFFTRSKDNSWQALHKVSGTMLRTETECRACVCSVWANRWRGSDSDCAVSHTHLYGVTVVRGYKSVRLYSFVKFWHGTDRKRQMTADSYMLLTICSLSPFLKVRSDAVRDS